MAVQGSEPREGIVPPCPAVEDVDEALRFRNAFAAEELHRSACAGGGLDVNLRIWKSLVCLTQEEPKVSAETIEYSMLASPGTLGGSTSVFRIRVPDADEAYARTVRCGAVLTMPPADTVWDERYGLVQDSFGYMWAITTVQQVLAPTEIAARLSATVGGK